jgi:hypothetical protein
MHLAVSIPQPDEKTLSARRARCCGCWRRYVIVCATVILIMIILAAAESAMTFLDHRECMPSYYHMAALWCAC